MEPGRQRRLHPLHRDNQRDLREGHGAHRQALPARDRHAQGRARSVRLESYRSVYGYVSKFVKDEFLRRCFSFHPLLIGGNPFNASSLYALIHYLGASGASTTPAAAPAPSSTPTSGCSPNWASPSTPTPKWTRSW
ncbi:MAG: hypothetical protein R2856_06615 [Caldilineaceae bacterium]